MRADILAQNVQATRQEAEGQLSQWKSGALPGSIARGRYFFSQPILFFHFYVFFPFLPYFASRKIGTVFEIDYRVAAINPELFSSYFQMTQHSWKSSDLIEVKANLHMYISRIILFIKTAVSIDNSLDPGPQALAGLHHGVPVEGPQHLLHLLDQILDFVARLFNDPYFRFAPHKIAKRVTIRQAGRPKPPPPTPPQLTARPPWASPASSCFRREGCHQLKDLMVISSYLSASYHISFS